MATASCGTLVRVVDEGGLPVAGAELTVVYPSITGAPSVTDMDGFARLSDSWLGGLLFDGTPQWVAVSSGASSTLFTYPPENPLVLRR